MNIKNISGERTSDLIITLARGFNAVLTFIFGYSFLYPLFNFLGVPDNDPSIEIFRIIAGVFLVVITDGAFVAWGNLEYRDGVTSEQMTTANGAKKWSLNGSLAASVGALVLLQRLVEFDPAITFVVSIGALIAAGALAILHVYWHAKYKSESEEATKADQDAVMRASQLDFDKTKRENAHALELKKQREAHELEMTRLNAEIDAEMMEAKAKAEIQMEMIQARVNHSRDVAKQTKEQLARRVSGTAGAIAKAESDQLMREFLAAAGHDINDFTDPN